MFQEWFDINYIAYEDPKVVFEDYYTNRLVRVNNLVKANAPKINNNVNTLRTVLWKKVSLLFISRIYVIVVTYFLL